jgi:hypothetical protein
MDKKRRVYQPRVFEGRIITSNEIERIHKEVLKFKRIEAISDPMRESIELRTATLAKLLRKAPMNLQLNEHIEEPGEIVFRHACELGFEGGIALDLRPLPRLAQV